MKRIPVSAIRYVVVGFGSLAIDYGLLIALYRLFGVGLPAATTFAFLVGLLANFWLNKVWSFGHNDNSTRTVRQAVYYSVLVAINLVLTGIIVSFLQSRSIGPEISKIVSTGVITIWNYVAYRYIIFAQPAEREIGDAPD